MYTSAAASRVDTQSDGSGTSHRSRTASLTAESQTWQKTWQMLMAEIKKKTKWQKVQSPTRQQRERFRLNLKSPVWKYFGFWSVDGKNAAPRDKAVWKLYKLQLAYRSTTSNMRAHLEKVHRLFAYKIISWVGNTAYSDQHPLNKQTKGV